MKHANPKWIGGSTSKGKRLQRRRDALKKLREEPASMPWFASQCGRTTYLGRAKGSEVCLFCGNFHMKGEERKS